MPLEVGALLPTRTVRDHRTGRETRVPWRPDGGSVLILPHTGCGECASFLEALDDAAGRFAGWARLRAVVMDESEADGLAENLAMDVLLDQAGALREGLKVTTGGAAVFVIDVHGQIFLSADLDRHDIPAMNDLALEARFSALQCPECETPDIPSQAAPDVPLGVPWLTTGTHPMIGPTDG